MAELDLRPDIMTAIEGFERSWVDVTMQNISKRVKACDQSAPLDTMSCDCMTYIRGMIEAAVSRGAKDALYTFGPVEPVGGSPRETDALREALAEMVEAMEAYEMDVNDEFTSPPYKHCEMMARARAALSTAPRTETEDHDAD